MMGLSKARVELVAYLRGDKPLHVTVLAAACLRAVDPAALNATLDDPNECRRYRRLRETASDILDAVRDARDFATTSNHLDYVPPPVPMLQSMTRLVGARRAPCKEWQVLERYNQGKQCSKIMGYINDHHCERQ